MICLGTFSSLPCYFKINLNSLIWKAYHGFGAYKSLFFCASSISNELSWELFDECTLWSPSLSSLSLSLCKLNRSPATREVAVSCLGSSDTKGDEKQFIKGMSINDCGKNDLNVDTCVLVLKLVPDADTFDKIRSSFVRESKSLSKGGQPTLSFPLFSETRKVF